MYADDLMHSMKSEEILSIPQKTSATGGSRKEKELLLVLIYLKLVF